MKDKPVILVVDDHIQNIALLEAHLVPQGYEILKAENGEEALEKLSNNQIDLVLLDVMMPRMSGFEVLEKLRADKKTRLIPVIMITVLKETEDRVKAIEAGCDDFISKPFDRHELLVRVKSLLRIKSLHDVVDEAREYAESIINTVREPLIALDQDLRVVTASRSFYEVFKVTPEETVGQLIYDLGNKQWNIPKLRELLETILPEKTTFDNYEVEHEFSSIGKRIMLLNARQIQRVSGKERIILLAIEDITERKRLEDLLTDSEIRYRRLFETANDGIVLLEKNEGHIVHANPAAEKMLGYSEKEYNGKMLQDIGVPLDMSDFPAIMQSLNKSGILNYDDVQVKTKSGQYIDTDIYMVDRARLAQCNIRDVTERKRAEEKLKFRNVILSTQQEVSIDGILVVDESNTIISYNQRFVEIWGIPPKLVESKDDEPVLQYVATKPVDSEAFLARVKYLYEHKEEKSFEEIALKDGRVIERYSAPMFGIDRRYYGRVWYFRDITDRKRAEAERGKFLQDLGDRVKEMGCINDISRLAEKHWNSIEEFVQQAVGILPPAWRYPEICAARIMLDSKKFKTANFRETEWSQSSDIIVDRKKFGAVTICYLEEKPAADEGPFLKEERNLINTIADFLGHIIQHRLSEAEIRASEEKFRMIFDNANDGILLADTESKIFHFANATICRMLGYSHEEIKNMGAMDIHPEKDIPYVVEQFEKQNRKEFEVAQDMPMKRKDGSVFYADVNSAPVEISGNSYLLSIFRDITERKQAEEEVKASEEKYRSIVESALIGVYRTNLKGDFLYVNEAIVKMFEFESPKELISFGVLPIYKNLKDREVLIGNLKNTGKVDNFELEILTKRGKTKNILMNATLDGDFISGMFIDITERKKAEDRIEYLAYYDSLTGLPNRNFFLERINQEIAETKNSSSSIAVVITDINKFKLIYDIYGSEVGDRVLKEVAERLSTAVRKGDTVSYLGNNEYAIACIGLAGADDIIMLEKIIKDISYPLKIDGDEITLTFSTGISMYPHDGENASELLKSAGMALSIAGKQGSKIFQFYTKDMTVTASEIMLLEKQLIAAIKNKEFILHYQPYWDINTKKMVGMEALVRWQSKDKGLVPPGKFIPVLEDTGMIIEVGEWILKEAMRQVKEWQNNAYPVVPVSVNMSLVQFRQKDLAEMVKKAMGECGFYPSLLTLEITESAFMQDIEFTKWVLTAMKEIGCSVSIDDFGTGYSSLAYLKRFPIDNLKIDISFIREMVNDPDSASIVMAIINMAHTLNLKTIAEGIETEEQWNFLRLLRCDMGQGFYLSKPLPAKEFEKLFNPLTPDK